MHTIAAGEMIRAGWGIFKKRPLFFIGAGVLLVIISAIVGMLSPDPVRNFSDFILAAAIIVVNVLIEMGLVAFALKAHDDVDEVSYAHLWHPQALWKYFAAKILTSIIVAGPMVLIVAAIEISSLSMGLRTLLLIALVPAVIWAVIAGLTLMFSTYAVIDRNKNPLEALTESRRMTTGHRWQLFVLGCALVLINILGALALLVGLLVSIPVSLLAVVHAYRKLAGKAAA